MPKKEISCHLQTSDYRERIYSPEVTLWAFLSQVIDADKSQQAAVSRIIAACIAEDKIPPSANTSGYSQARSRFPEQELATITRENAKQVVSGTPQSWLWRNKRIKLVDGSRLSMPDTIQNQLEYPQPESQKAGVGFPIARILVVVDYITGVVQDYAISKYSGQNTGEHALLRQLMHLFNSDDVMLADAYYPSFFLMATLIKEGIAGVFAVKTSRTCDFKTGIKLGKKDHIALWEKPRKPFWMTKEEYEQFPKTISVREVAVSSECPGYRTKHRVLVTTFLDPKEVSKEELGKLYAHRWFVELTLRSIKTTMHMDILRGKTPAMVRKEIWMHFLAYNLIRKIMAQAAWLYGKPIFSLSFKLALQCVNSFQQAGLFKDSFSMQYQQLFQAISHKKVGNRLGREEPRCVKRRQRTYSKLQKERKLYKNVA